MIFRPLRLPASNRLRVRFSAASNRNYEAMPSQRVSPLFSVGRGWNCSTNKLTSRHKLGVVRGIINPSPTSFGLSLFVAMSTSDLTPDWLLEAKLSHRRLEVTVHLTVYSCEQRSDDLFYKSIYVTYIATALILLTSPYQGRIPLHVLIFLEKIRSFRLQSKF